MRRIISLAAIILVGLIFLISGSGKVIGFGEMPGQTMEYLDIIIPDALYTPAVASFIGNVFLPYIIPWAELLLGILLILCIWPRIMAIIGLLFSMAFMTINSWLISIGMEQFPSCACFGIWEEIFGTLTPLQSVYIDIGLFILCLTIIIIYPGTFLSLPHWLAKLRKKSRAAK